MAVSLTKHYVDSLIHSYWSEKVRDRLSGGGMLIGIPYRERCDDAYIEMKRRIYAEEDRRFAVRQHILELILAACMVALLIVL